jgi:hypothetical protein
VAVDDVMTTDTLTAALDYAARGWRVIPVLPGTKRPRGQEWQLRATTDAGTLTSWWGSGEDGIGIATGPASGIFVLDVDITGDKAGDETLAELEALYGQLPDTLEVRTGSGGRHIYFNWPQGHDIRNDASSRLGPGLDIRGDGGQVVAPPTIHPNGTRYEWDLGCDTLADAPGWLLQLLTEDPWNGATATGAANPPSATARAQDYHSAPFTPKTLSPALSDTSPAEHYNQLTTWTEILTADGWTLDHTDRSGEQHWVRPGKDTRDGTSATVMWKGQDMLRVFTTSLPWLPEGAYSRFGYMACRHHGGDRSAAARAVRKEMEGWTSTSATTATSSTPASNYAIPGLTLPGSAIPAPEQRHGTPTNDDQNPLDDPLHLVTWPDFWTDDDDGVDWLLEPLIARGRGHALYAGAKTGKSLLMLAACAALATGKPFLRQPAGPPVRILYLDYEMTAADLRERLEGYGYGPDDDLSCLHYALLPSIPPLDTELGAAIILERATTLDVAHVVIDTTSRAISGEENSADTFRALYRLLGMRLKGADIGFHRIDHSGKDAEKGQRGSSAKNDDVDVVQRLEARDKGAFVLRATHRRMMWVPEAVDIVKDESDVVTWTTEQATQPTGTYHIVKWLDDHEVPATMGRDKVRALLKSEGQRAENAAISAALKIRKRRLSEGLENLSAGSADSYIGHTSGPVRSVSGQVRTGPESPWSEACDLSASSADRSGQVPEPDGTCVRYVVTDRSQASPDSAPEPPPATTPNLDHF